MATFNVGDTVRLKSGSLKMTIDKFVWNPLKGESYTDKVECVWFEDGKLQRQVFQTSSLELD
jgi:uncharacterized protein YodC (DUF2158 family)